MADDRSNIYTFPSPTLLEDVPPPPLRGGGGGGTSGGMTEDWKANVDRQLDQLHGDVRHLLFGLIGGFLFLLAAGAAAYVKLSDQLIGVQGQLQGSITSLQVGQSDLRGDLKLHDAKFETIDKKLDAVLAKLDAPRRGK